MHSLDWTVLTLYFVLMVGVGVWARSKVSDARDFFTAGGAMPWWLSGISHHMSGYSSAVFVGYAAIAYTDGFTLYIWWACSIALALVAGSGLFAPRWARLRSALGVISPLEYLAIRYDVPTQQLLAWSGALLKIFDTGAKWTSAALLLQVFGGVPFVWGVLLTGGVTLIYSVVGGLWADALTDFSQFLIQIVAGLAMLVAVMIRLGGPSALWTMWDRLPPTHHHPFAGQYTPWFAVAFLAISFLSYNGGTWNLAQRFMAAPNAQSAERAALLSAGLYLVWAPILFFPMWAAPILLPKLADPSQAYALLTQQLLPNGLIGLVLAGMFAHTMAMTSSDANAVSAVVVRDILPVLRRGRAALSTPRELFAGRAATFVFLALSMLLGMAADHFGGVMGLILLWYGALLGPIAMPMLLGLLPAFRTCGPAAAVSSLVAGAVGFLFVKFLFAPAIAGWREATSLVLAVPISCAFVAFVGVGLMTRSRTARSDELLAELSAASSAAFPFTAIHPEPYVNSLTELRVSTHGLSTLIAPSRDAMGALAAAEVAQEIRRRLSHQSEVRMVFAAAPSQSEMLAALRVAPGIAWERVTAFHLDEYIGLPDGAPQRFGLWLKGALFDHLPFKQVYLLEPGDDPEAAANAYAARLAEAPIDIVCLGIGANGHLAFNDPPADLNDPRDVRVVTLDAACRQQQVDDDCFNTLSDVPSQALTLTVPRLLRAHALFCVVPGLSKRAAVARALSGPIDGDCPASALRTHAACKLYLEPASAPDE